MPSKKKTVQCRRRCGGQHQVASYIARVHTPLRSYGILLWNTFYNITTRAFDATRKVSSNLQ